MTAFVLFSHLVLPGLIESRLAANLQEEYGLQEEPEVRVSSNLPELWLGRMDRIEVWMDRLMREGILLRDLRMEGCSSSCIFPFGAYRPQPAPYRCATAD